MQKFNACWPLFCVCTADMHCTRRKKHRPCTGVSWSLGYPNQNSCNDNHYRNVKHTQKIVAQTLRTLQIATLKATGGREKTRVKLESIALCNACMCVHLVPNRPFSTYELECDRVNNENGRKNLSEKTVNAFVCLSPAIRTKQTG